MWKMCAIEFVGEDCMYTDKLGSFAKRILIESFHATIHEVTDFGIGIAGI